MTEAAKKAVKEAPAAAKAVAEVTKPAAKQPVKMSDIVDVKNISKKLIHTSKGQIKPGEKGKCTLAEARTYHKYVEQV